MLFYDHAYHSLRWCLVSVFHQQLWEQFDSIVREALCRILGVSLSQQQWAQATLTVAVGELGLRSAFGAKNFWTQHFFGPKIFLNPIFFGHKIFWTYEFFNQFFWTKIFFGPKIFSRLFFWTKNFLGKFLGPNFLDKNILDPKFLGTENFSTENF